MVLGENFMSNEEYIPKRAMSIHAHPDDQEFSIGGTLAKWAKAAAERGVLLVPISAVAAKAKSS